jgi:hypothetical protein
VHVNRALSGAFSETRFALTVQESAPPLTSSPA